MYVTIPSAMSQAPSAKLTKPLKKAPDKNHQTCLFHLNGMNTVQSEIFVSLVNKI